MRTPSCESRVLIQSVELVSHLDSDWAGDPSSRKSQSSSHVEVDGCPLTSFFRRQICVATSGMAEYNAMCSVAEELLHLRSILEHFGFRVHTNLFCDSVAARGIAQRDGLLKVEALAVKTLSSRFLQEQTKLTWEVLLVARLNAFRAACGIVVPSGLLNESVEDENDDGQTALFSWCWARWILVTMAG